MPSSPLNRVPSKSDWTTTATIHLGRIFFIRAGQKIGGVVKIEKHLHEQFMEGVAASGVPQAAQVLELLKANQTIEVTFVEREEKL
jgi:hypothetical protein